MRRMQLHVACLAALVACGVGGAAAGSLEPMLRALSPSNLRIVGGTQAAISDYPWQLLLRVPGKRGATAYCGASLISPRWVLTAAHCFLGYDASRPIEVLEGLSYRGRDEERYEAMHRVDRPILNPGYNKRNQDGDIALLHLGEDAKSEPIEPLMSADATLELPPAQGLAMGWGTVTRIEQRHGTMVDYNTKQPIAKHGLLMPHGLMKVELPLVDVDRCRAANRGMGLVSERSLCAGAPGGGKDTCKGDSGGPLVAESKIGHYVQIGVTSWGQGCGESDHPGVYTRVSAYADWIRSITKENMPAGSPAKPMPAKPAPPNPVATTTGAPLPPQYDNAAGLNVKLVAVKQKEPVLLDAAAVRPGQQVAVVVTTRKPGFLIILDETPDGRLTQIYPNSYSSRAQPNDRRQASLEPGREITVPDPRNPYAGFAYIVDKTPGDGMISVLQSDRPLRSVDLETNGVKSFASGEASRTYLANLSQELSRSFLSKADDTPKYSAVYLPYTVKP